jgi:hypothetical protein
MTKGDRNRKMLGLDTPLPSQKKTGKLSPELQARLAFLLKQYDLQAESLEERKIEARGYDYAGREEWEWFMRRIGRRL